MNARRAVLGGVAVMSMLAWPQAQTTTQSKEAAGKTEVKTEKMTGEVVHVEGNRLLAKMVPGGQLRLFDVKPDRQFVIDGQPKQVGDLKPGTVLTATVITTTQPLTVRTATVVNGTVWWASGSQVILTLDNGENRLFNVPDSYEFVVEGKPARVTDLRRGMKVSGTRIVSEPQTQISEKTVVTGKSPK
jgi:RNase P/RNase MRP subunit p29